MPTYYCPHNKQIVIAECNLIISPQTITSVLTTLPNSWLKNASDMFDDAGYWNVARDVWQRSQWFNEDGSYKVNAPYPQATTKFVIGRYANYGILVVDEMPAYNPILSVHNINFNNSSDEKQIAINPLTVDYLEVSNATVTFDLYLQTKNNTPPITINPGDTITLQCSKVVSNIILDPTNSGTVIIKELLNGIKFDRNPSNYVDKGILNE